MLGYAATELRPIDMIPHSAAVECLVTIRRTAIPKPIVVYEDDELLAVVKSGYEPISATPTCAGALLERVRELAGASDALPVPSSRLDADCSGICLFARSHTALAQVELACAGGRHTFLGLARGVSHKKGSIRRPVRVRGRSELACTQYRREAVHGGHSLLALRPERGEASTLRRHLAGIGHPILGDAQFGDAASNSYFEHRHGLDRSFLHRSALTLARARGPLTLEAPLPGELSAVLASLSDPTASRG